MRLLKFAAFMVAQTALIWGVSAFAVWAPHPADWPVDVRAGAAAVWAGFTFFVVLSVLAGGWE